MKTNRLLITVVLIISGGFLVNLSAQKALNAVVAKMEKMDNISVNIVKDKDKDTKKVILSIMNFNFKNNESLKKEILSAFEKDKEMADRESENKEQGRRTSLLYRFGNTSFSYSEDKDGNISFSVRENSDERRMPFYNQSFFNPSRPDIKFGQDDLNIDSKIQIENTIESVMSKIYANASRSANANKSAKASKDANASKSTIAK